MTMMLRHALPAAALMLALPTARPCRPRLRRARPGEDGPRFLAGAVAGRPQGGVRQAHGRLRCQQGHARRCGSRTCSRATRRRRCASRRKAGTSIRRRSRPTARRSTSSARRSGVQQLYAHARRRRHAEAADRLRAGRRQLQVVAGRQAVALGVETYSPTARPTSPARKKTLRRQSRQEQGHRRGVRPHVHPPLGHVGGRHACNRLFVAPLRRQGAGATAATAGRRRRRRRRAFQTVRRHQRVRMVARWRRRSCSAHARPTHGEPWSTNFDLYQVSCRRQRRGEEPDRGQSGVGHRPGLQRRRQDAVLPRDEAPGLRGRPLRADGDGSRQRGSAREIAPQWDRSADSITLSDDGKTHLHHRAGPRRASAVRGRDRRRQGRRRSSATVRCRRSRSQDRRWPSRATR